MNIYIFSIAIIIIVTIIAAYFDIKKGIIPNKLTISLFLFGIAINSIFSILYNNNSYIFNSITLTVFTFLLTYTLWKFKIWAGGDVKLFTAIASSISNSPKILEFKFFNLYLPKIAIYPFPLTVIFNSILISFPFLVVFLLIKKYNVDFKEKNFNLKKSNNKIDFKQKICYLKRFISSFTILNQIYSKKRIIFKKILYSLIFSSLFIIFTGIYKNSYHSIYILSFGAIFSLTSSSLFKLGIKKFKKFLKSISYKKVSIYNLNEGMIVDKTYFNIVKSYSSHFDGLINDIDNNDSNLKIKKISTKKDEKELTKYLLNSSTAAGLSDCDILFLKKLFKMNFINENIQIKIGIPFAPSIAIGLIIAIFIGDLCVLFANILNNILNYLYFI